MKITRAILISLIVFSALQFFCLAGEPPSGTIVVYGDSRDDHPIHEQIADAIIKTRPKIVFHTGDIISNKSGPKYWEEPLRIISKLKNIAEFFPAMGNHDTDLFFRNFNLPNNGHWYSVEREGIHFIVLDTNSEIDGGSVQYKWLEDDLAGIKDKDKFIVAIFHHPILNTGYHSGSGKALKFFLVPLFEKYGVDVVFSGHDHDYERSRYHNIYYIVTGGGGAPLYGKKEESPYTEYFLKEYHFCLLSHQGNKLIVTVLDPYFNILDEFTVTKGG